MYKYLLLVIVIYFTLSTECSAHHKDKRMLYWIDGGVTLLAFVGNPNTLNVKPVKFTTFQKQTIKLLHKKSGPGIYAFNLYGLVIKNEFGAKEILFKEGYILVKRRWIRSTEWKKKVSLKYKTMKGNYQ